MSGVDEGRRRSAGERVLALADESLYRRNPFRVTGLATAATGRAVREQRQRALSAYAPATVRSRLPLPETPSAETVRAAYDELGRPERRLVAELFWLWDEPAGCGCAPGLHDAHDVAVLTHAAALDRPTDLASWRAAAAQWSAVLAGDGLRAHLSYRVRVLADRRLDESTVDGVLAALPRALVGPIAAVAATAEDPAALLDGLDDWPVDRATADEVRHAAAAGTLDAVTDLLGEVGRLLTDDPARAADRATTALVPAATALEALLPHGRYRRSATVRDQVAVALNNCGVALCEARGARPRPATVTAVYRQATRFAVTADTRETVRTNRSAAEMLVALDRARRPGRPRPSYPGRRVPRVLAGLGYLAMLVTMVAAVASAGPLPTAVAVLVGLYAMACVAGSPPGRLRAYLGWAGALGLPVLLLAATGAVSGTARSALGYAAAVVLFVVAVALAGKRGRR